MKHLAGLAAVALLAGCTTASGGQVASGAGRSVELLVFGAASLQRALERIGAAWEAANPGTTIVLSTDSSAALAAHIEQGAPADLFLSADTTQPQALADSGLTDGVPIPFAANRLTLVVPDDNPAGIETPADLAADGVRIVAAGEDVPVTGYAREVVRNLTGLDGYPTDFAERYAANVVSREDNVSAVVTKIRLGEGDAGIVYATDAAAAEGISTVVIPGEANVEATYAGVVVGGSRSPAAARGLLEWIVGPHGQAILAELGFLPPPSP